MCIRDSGTTLYWWEWAAQCVNRVAGLIPPGGACIFSPFRVCETCADPTRGGRCPPSSLVWVLKRGLHEALAGQLCTLYCYPSLSIKQRLLSLFAKERVPTSESVTYPADGERSFFQSSSLGSTCGLRWLSTRLKKGSRRETVVAATLPLP